MTGLWVAVCLFVGMPLCCQVGYWLGRHARLHPDGNAMSQTMNWQTAVLALAALLIGFTFAMAMQRFEDRKHILVDEANAIGTAYLRTRLVGETEGEEIRALMRQYLEGRVALYDINEPAAIEAAERGSEVLQQQIWSRVVAAARNDAHPVLSGRLVDTVNEMIDISDERRAIRDNPVPYTAFFVLVLVSAIGMASIGHTCGAARKQLLFGMLVMPLLVAAVIVLVYDLANVSSGLVRPGNQSLVQLRRSL